jgi:protein O-GlcNAc transferase
MKQNRTAHPGVNQIVTGAGFEYDAWHAAGREMLNQGRLDEAERVFRRIAAANPKDAAAWCFLGMISEASQNLQEAEFAYLSALAADPRLAEAHANLGGVLNRQGRSQEAEAACREAIRLNPTLAAGYNNLGIALQSLNRLVEAEAALRHALATQPNLAQAEGNLAAVLREQCRAEEAGNHARRAIELGIRHPGLHSDWLSSQQYVADAHPARLAELHADWERRYAAGLKPAWRSDKISREPDRRLRLGFVSPDFRRHPVSYNLVRALENLDPGQFDVVCFSDVRVEDDMTARLKRLASGWKCALGMSDEALANEIAENQIDILFDLTGHGAGNRLLTIARRPAPLQIAWLGLPGTTGLKTMDYIIADRLVIPESGEEHYTERVLRLPTVYAVYDPPGNASEAGPLPMDKNGFITFGCLNNPLKVGPRVLAVWARILHRVPGSRLLLRYRDKYQIDGGRRYRECLASHGIGGDRLVLPEAAPSGNFMDHYLDIDIALDSFPYSGGATTCEALWMGVPVVTCPHKTFSSRHSTTFLSCVGLGELVATDMAHYQDLAVSLASDRDRLETWRKRLRAQMASSPLCDGKRFAGEWTQAVRQAWRQWCAADGQVE